MYEIVNKRDGSKLSRTSAGEMMGTTLFKSEPEAQKWFLENHLSVDEFEVKTAKGK